MILDNPLQSSIITELLEGTSYKREEVKALINFQFKFVGDVIQSGFSPITGGFQSVRLMHLGMFYVTIPKLRIYLRTHGDDIKYVPNAAELLAYKSKPFIVKTF